MSGLKDVLIDYYVSATDSVGNTKKTDIYHVYVGNGNAACTEVWTSLDNVGISCVYKDSRSSPIISFDGEE